MLQLKVPTYAFHAGRGYFLSRSYGAKLGGSNLHQSKLVFAALNLSVFFAQRCQLRTYLPVLANAASAGRPPRQHAPAIAKVVEILVCARSAALLDHDAVFVRHPFSCFFLHFCCFCVGDTLILNLENSRASQQGFQYFLSRLTPLGLPKGSLFQQCQRALVIESRCKDRQLFSTIQGQFITLSQSVSHI